ncbi:MAG: FIVAR domain-containing protein [Actinomycetota bacterium]|nr:FIVAR domain-containing protein [Actinomycetota bacterium]
MRKKIVIAVIIILALGVVAYVGTTPVKVGKKVLCRYGHVIEDSTRIIRVPRWMANRFKVKTVKSICERHKKCEELYAKAQKQLAEKKLSQAKKILEKVSKLDPKFESVKTQLQQIEAAVSGTPPSPGTTPGAPPTPGIPTPSPGTPPTPGVSTPPAVDLAALLPKDIPGFTTGNVARADNYACCGYIPKDHPRVESLLISVYNRGSLESAKAFIDSVSKKAFPSDAKTATIRGHRAYFGTDVTTYATLSWYDGVIVYEIHMMSATGKPKELYEDIVAVTKYIP